MFINILVDTEISFQIFTQNFNVSLIQVFVISTN